MRSTQAHDPDGTHADPGDRHVKTGAELFTDRYFQQAAHVRGASRDGPGRDWRLIRAAEASAREIGMRASVPDPAATRIAHPRAGLSAP